MNTFMMAAAMNPNISEQQLIELAEIDANATLRLVKTFEDCLSTMKTDKERIWYFNACFPILMMNL